MTKNKGPLVSVIVNCHNGEKYLSKSINSILNQTYKNLEIIFCNNKSKDNSEKILKSFKDKRIKYFKTNKYMKLYEARNFAIKKSSGKFISFLDVDDYWVPSKIQKQMELFKKNNKLTLVYSNCYILRNRSNSIKKFVNQILPTGIITQNLLDHYKMPILTVVIKKKFFKKRIFNKKYEIIGDFDLFVDLSIKNQVDCVQQPLAYYRVHESNFSRKKIDVFVKEFENWIELNKNLKKMKSYSFQGVFLQVQVLKIKKYFLENLKFKAFLEILKYPISYKKLKFLILIFLPKNIVNKIQFY